MPVKRKVKKSSRKSSRKVTKRVKPRRVVARKSLSVSKKFVVSKKKMNLSLVNLLVFGFLSLISYSLYKWIFTTGTLSDFFWITYLILAFIAVAFLVAYLVLVFMKAIRK
ncbi:hypothetical protein COU59_03645 [Candidatus Pacearchaeota archaeon CG10_big_fil_rev_8_21_14_0_10_34_12]|nr:MAG: hypothetical protein COU59_03645 [Candidatus Pacearchaeota archaeon CG10_big_fil_rev_8_21_14_0_10_34_12]